MITNHIFHQEFLNLVSKYLAFSLKIDNNQSHFFILRLTNIHLIFTFLSQKFPFNGQVTSLLNSPQEGRCQRPIRAHLLPPSGGFVFNEKETNIQRKGNKHSTKRKQKFNEKETNIQRKLRKCLF